MKMYPKDLIFGAFLWYGLTAIVTLAFFPPTNGVWSETFKAMGVALAAATGLFAPISSIVMARYQGQVTSELEALKKDYNREIEILKSSLSSGLEVKKALIAGRIRAFDTMLTAAHFFYYVIRQQAFGGLVSDNGLLVDADKRAAEASSVVWHLSDDDRGRWFTVYQLSIHLANILRETPVDDRIDLFNKHAQDLGTAIEALEEAGLAAFAEADKFQLKLSEDEFRISGRPFIR